MHTSCPYHERSLQDGRISYEEFMRVAIQLLEFYDRFFDTFFLSEMNSPFFPERTESKSLDSKSSKKGIEGHQEYPIKILVENEPCSLFFSLVFFYSFEVDIGKMPNGRFLCFYSMFVSA